MFLLVSKSDMANSDMLAYVGPTCRPHAIFRDPFVRQHTCIGMLPTWGMCINYDAMVQNTLVMVSLSIDK